MTLISMISSEPPPTYSSRCTDKETEVQVKPHAQDHQLSTGQNWNSNAKRHSVHTSESQSWFLEQGWFGTEFFAWFYFVFKKCVNFLF